MDSDSHVSLGQRYGRIVGPQEDCDQANITAIAISEDVVDDVQGPLGVVAAETYKK